MVNGLPLDDYIRFWFFYTNSFGFNEIKFLEMLKHMKFNGRFLTDDEIKEIHSYAISCFCREGKRG